MEKTIRLLASILALCILGGAIFLTLALISPPAPLPVDAPAAAFSAGRAMQDLEIIAREPRPMGVFPAHAAARDYLLGEIRAQSIEPQVQDTFGVRFWGPASGYISGGFVENIIARLPGSGPDGAILLLAHYDSTPGGPGAADNAAGVVTILELLRALQAGPQLRQDVIFLFADGEEPGTFGAHAFVAQHTRVDEIKCVINLDTITHAPPALLRTSGGNGFWIQAWSRSGASRSAFLSLPYHLFSGSETDLFPFEKAGIPGADFAATGAFTELHTSEDRIEVVSPASLQHTGEQLLALVRYLGDQDGLEFNAADQTFFPALGQLIHYPSGWAIPLAVLASLCFLGTLIYGLRKRNLTWLGVGLSWLAFLVFLVASIGIAYLIWHGLQALHPEYAYSTVRPHLSDDALYASGFFVLALAIVIGVIIVVRKKATTLDLAAGALVIWLPGAIVTAILVPATSYLATWVLMLNSLSLLLALALQSKKNAWLWAGLAFLVSAILVTFLWLPVIFVTFLGAGFRMWWLMIGVAAIWVGALLPTWDWITSLKRWPLPVAALLAALGFLLAGHVLVGRELPSTHGQLDWLLARCGW